MICRSQAKLNNLSQNRQTIVDIILHLTLFTVKSTIMQKTSFIPLQYSIAMVTVLFAIKFYKVLAHSGTSNHAGNTTIKLINFWQ